MTYIPDNVRIKLVVDTDPADLNLEKRILDELCAYLYEKHQYKMARAITEGDLPDAEWRRPKEKQDDS